MSPEKLEILLQAVTENNLQVIENAKEVLYPDQDESYIRLHDSIFLKSINDEYSERWGTVLKQMDSSMVENGGLQDGYSCQCPICGAWNGKGLMAHCNHYLTAISIHDGMGKSYYFNEDWENVEELVALLESKSKNQDEVFSVEDKRIQMVMDVFRDSGGLSPAAIWESVGAITIEEEIRDYGFATWCFVENQEEVLEKLNELLEDVLKYLGKAELGICEE